MEKLTKKEKELVENIVCWINELYEIATMGGSDWATGLCYATSFIKEGLETKYLGGKPNRDFVKKYGPGRVKDLEDSEPSIKTSKTYEKNIN